jgi:hypothetical protein
MKFTQAAFDYNISNEYLSIKENKLQKIIINLKEEIENEYFIFVQSLSVNIPDPLDIYNSINKKHLFISERFNKNIRKINLFNKNSKNEEFLNYISERINKINNEDIYLYAKNIINSYKNNSFSIDFQKQSFFESFIQRKTPMHKYEEYSLTLTNKYINDYRNEIKHDDNQRHIYLLNEKKNFNNIKNDLCIKGQLGWIVTDLIFERININNVISIKNQELKNAEEELKLVNELSICLKNVNYNKTMYIPNNIYDKFINPLVELTEKLSNNINEKIFHNAIIAFNFNINIINYYSKEEEYYKNSLIKSIPSFLLKCNVFKQECSGFHTAFIDFTFFLIEDEKYLNKINQSLVNIKEECIIDYINVLQKVKSF